MRAKKLGLRGALGSGAGSGRSVRIAAIGLGKITAARAHLVALVIGDFHFDSVIASIENVIRGLIRNGILVAKLVADVLKGLVEIVDVVRKERAASRFFRQILKNLVSLS